ncbi:MAG TPA: hypothetical protein VFE50_16935 [Cyclobacteriaceae bacterium]|nr:hypothetical protein [Cyclobacteriaceae bacterium]
MAVSDVVTMFSILLGIVVTGFGGIGLILLKLYRALGRIDALIENHERRISKLERKRYFNKV